MVPYSAFPFLATPSALTLQFLWSWATGALLHVSWAHIIGNFMYLLAPMLYLETKYSKRTLLKAYVAFALGSGIAWAFFGAGSAVGASGAISGIAAMALMRLSMGGKVRGPAIAFLTLTLLQQLDGVVSGAPFVAYAGHLGGILAALILFPHFGVKTGQDSTVVAQVAPNASDVA